MQKPRCMSAGCRFALKLLRSISVKKCKDASPNPRMVRLYSHELRQWADAETITRGKIMNDKKSFIISMINDGYSDSDIEDALVSMCLYRSYKSAKAAIKSAREVQS